MKSKLRDACEKYWRITVPYKHRKNIENLSKRGDAVILKQDKGRGLVLMNKNKYTEKCMLLPNTKKIKSLTMTLRRRQKGRFREC